jgi:DNA polymerase V
MATSRRNKGGGFPSPAEDWLEARLRLDDLIERPASTFLVRVRGGAMTAEGIREGDVLVVDRALTPRHGSVVVAFAGGEMVARRWEIGPDGPTLVAGDGTVLSFRTDAGDLLWGVVCYAIHAFER